MPRDGDTRSPQRRSPRARRLGISRRAPRIIDFQRITPASRLQLAHAHADIANAAEFPCEHRCPCHVAEHLEAGFADTCARLWWQQPLEAAKHRLALFASFTIPQIEVGPLLRRTELG
jgi:hypothetical protein